MTMGNDKMPQAKNFTPSRFDFSRSSIRVVLSCLHLKLMKLLLDIECGNSNSHSGIATYQISKICGYSRITLKTLTSHSL